eukprot:3697371-Pleurochrysis_carterae.AAC.2
MSSRFVKSSVKQRLHWTPAGYNRVRGTQQSLAASASVRAVFASCLFACKINCSHLPHRGRHLLLDRRLLAQGARVGVGPRRQLGGADSGLAHQQ